MVSLEEDNIISFILSGKNRIKIFLLLENNLMAPSDISKKIGIDLSSVCKSLKDLSEQEILHEIRNFASNKRFYRINCNYIHLKIKINEIATLRDYLI